jgi:hypothetical protein
MKTMLTFTSLALVGMLAAAPARAQQTRNIVDDTQATNGVIHVIDTVILPNGI